MKLIAYIDTEIALMDKLSTYFITDNIKIDFYKSVELCIDDIRNGVYSLILLNTSSCDGWIFKLTDIRKNSDIPIIVLAEQRNITDIVTAFRLGADDYIAVNSTETIEIALRVKAVLRRERHYDNESIIQNESILVCNDIQIDINKHIVLKNSKEIELTKTEFELLYFLARHKEQILSREQIYAGVWSNEYIVDDKSIISHIHRLRMKIEDKPSEPEYILTVRGFGYKFVVSSKAYRIE